MATAFSVLSTDQGGKDPHLRKGKVQRALVDLKLSYSSVSKERMQKPTKDPEGWQFWGPRTPESQHGLLSAGHAAHSLFYVCGVVCHIQRIPTSGLILPRSLCAGHGKALVC